MPDLRARAGRCLAHRPELSDYLPNTPAGRLLAFSALTSSFGVGLFLAGATVFFTGAAGLTHVQLGVGLGIAACVGLVAAVPLGWLADRVGARPVLVGALIWRALCFVCLAYVQGPVAFTVAASLQAAARRRVAHDRSHRPQPGGEPVGRCGHGP